MKTNLIELDAQEIRQIEKQKHKQKTQFWEDDRPQTHKSKRQKPRFDKDAWNLALEKEN
jgi:hypothetical protein